MCRLLTNRRARDVCVRLHQFVRGESGATAVEYAVMLALIIMVMIGTIGQFGSETHGLWSGSIDRLDAVGFMK